VRVVSESIAKDARFTVRCECGFAEDSKAESGADAIAHALERHHHEGAALTFTAVRTTP